MIKKYIKKPVIIEALQWTGYNYNEVEEYMGKENIVLREYMGDKICSLVIRTLEGNMIASVGDFIIKGIKGEFYPCKPDIFFETYDMIEN